MQIGSREYWVEIADMARDITREAHEEGREIGDVLHEWLNDHQWVIYTALAHEVLMHSDNDEYSLVEGFYEPKAGEPLDWSALAFGAMYADVTSHSNFGEILDEWDEGEDEDEDDDEDEE